MKRYVSPFPRDRRNEALDRFADAARQRLSEISSLNKGNIHDHNSHGLVPAGLVAVWDAKTGLKAWFGSEVSANADRVEKALAHAYASRFDWCHDPNSTNDEFQIVVDQYFIAMKVLGEMIDEAQPYVAAGQRGLPLGIARRLRRGYRQIGGRND